MGSIKGQNNLKKYQKDKLDETSTDIKNALNRFSKRKQSFKSKTQLANMVADVIGKNPKHLLKYYSVYLEEYILSQAGGGIDMIPDNSASPDVLLAKLRKERLKNASLQSGLKRMEVNKSDNTKKTESAPSEYEIAFSQTAKILHELLTRLKGTIDLDESTGQIVDTMPPAGYSDIVADKALTKYYANWLKNHPNPEKRR